MYIRRLIFNEYIFNVNCADRYVKRTEYTSFYDLFTEKFEQKEKPVWIAETMTSMDIWLTRIATLLDLNKNFYSRTKTRTSGCGFLLINADCKAQMGHSDIECMFCISSDYLRIAHGPEKEKIYVCLGSRLYVHYNREDKEILRKTVKTISFFLPPLSFIVANGCLQHAGAAFLGHHKLR